MSTLTLDRWLADQGLVTEQTLPPVPVTGVALDTRELRAGDIFLALRGGSDHGLRHAQAAIDKGA
ncbi:MAG: UDP-N-acetylmuramoyl-L-alanyl-D-glutamate--2,6-diaminopimelate ligase, partial [Xanthomonadales bacterium]|nr:UDP-N-acetylmuramoyl-L-alanyl-D-glutamate--2,6-diaminopimelate ligase [Xanthomonadales bacterium]